MQQVRYRCDLCGNITRFDVVETITCKSFYHYSLSGELSIEDKKILSKEVKDVICRWCGHGKNVKEIN